MNIRRFFLGPVADTALRYWYVLPIVLLALWGWRVDSLRGHYKDSLVAQAASYRQAQAEASSNALSAKIQKEAEYAKKADAADARYAGLSGQYHAAVLRYQAAQRAAGKADLPESTKATEGSDGSGAGSILPIGQLMIPEADAFICAENTGRLQAVREWALSLDPN
jgi:hypothetical protein